MPYWALAVSLRSYSLQQICCYDDVMMSMMLVARANVFKGGWCRCCSDGDGSCVCELDCVRHGAGDDTAIWMVDDGLTSWSKAKGQHLSYLKTMTKIAVGNNVDIYSL